MKEEIIVLIKKDGEIQAEVQGVKGKRCVEITAFISALGESTRTLKGDYLQRGKVTVSPMITDLIKL
jgi:hypothetical protein